jgi:filamentous hemagglutinin family protein
MLICVGKSRSGDVRFRQTIMPSSFGASRALSRCLCLLLLSCSLLFSDVFTPSQAQISTAITPDRTLGTVVTQRGNVFTITGGRRPDNGPNLFHSFDRFNVGTNDIARFRSPQRGIENILSRVTGGVPSIIDGRLRSEIPGAHLYLLNPSGVVFGPNAILDVSGSFHVSTADFLRLQDGGTFAADLGTNSVLTIAAPAAFGFLRNNPAAISVLGSTLRVSPGKAMSVIGGDIAIVGGLLEAPSGQVNMASLGSPGEVIPSASNAAPALNVDTVARLGDVTISDLTVIDVSGDGGGTVVIRGRHLRVDNSQIFANTLGNTDGAEIGVDVQVADGVMLSKGALLTTDVFGAGNAGNIQLTARRVQVVEGSEIASSAFSTGRAGTITVTARDSVTLDGALSGISSITFGAGDAGAIMVSAPIVSLADGGQLATSTSGTGAGGMVMVTATEFVTVSGIAPGGALSGISSITFGAGDAGAIMVSAPIVRLTDGGRIDSRTQGTGVGGAVTVTATESIIMDGFPSQLFSGTLMGSGDAGSITVSAPIVNLTGGAQISSTTFAGAGKGGAVTVTATDSVAMEGLSGIVSTALGGTGDAGAITISAPTVRLTGGAGIEASTTGFGRGGTVRVTATESLTITGVSPDDMRRPSGISSGSAGTGNGGTIIVSAPIVRLMEGAVIDTSTTVSGTGGTIRITAMESLTIAGRFAEDRPSAITSGSTGEGVGGEIVLEATTIELTEGALITARSEGVGDAGNLMITATNLLSANSEISTEAIQADGGDITLQAQLVNLRESILTAEAMGVDQQGSDGGNVTIQAGFVILDHSQIQANAFGGNGGNIVIAVEDAFLADTETCEDQMCLNASSRLGVAGTVEVSTPTADLSGVVTPLPQTFTQAAALLPERCAERLQGQLVSTLVLAGRDSLPLQPGGVLPSPLSAEGKPVLSKGKRPLEHAFTSPMRGFVDNGHPEQTKERHGQRFSARVLGYTCTAQPAARRP